MTFIWLLHDFLSSGSQVQKLSNSMDLIANGVTKLKNINTVSSELEAQLQEKRVELVDLQTKLKKYTSYEWNKYIYIYIYY